MKQHNQLSEHHLIKKPSLEIQQPHDFHFYYQNKISQFNTDMSPTSTCHSQQKLKNWFTQLQEHTVYFQKQEENLTTISFGIIEGNIIPTSVQKYCKVLSDYLKNMTKDYSGQSMDFLSIKQLQGLNFQKQQFLSILDKYNENIKSTKNVKEMFNAQNSSIRSFMEEITYLNYQQINLELIDIVCEMIIYNTKKQTNNTEIQEFLQQLSNKPTLQYISFKLINSGKTNQNRQNIFVDFLHNLFQIISQLYLHHQVFQQQKIAQPEIIRNQLKLFSSQRDLWDSDDQQIQMTMSCPCKKVKFSFDQ